MADEHILEAIVLYLDDEGVHHLHPLDAPTLHLGWPSGKMDRFGELGRGFAGARSRDRGAA